jgi:hypothetical protein
MKRNQDSQDGYATKRMRLEAKDAAAYDQGATHSKDIHRKPEDWSGVGMAMHAT